MLEIDFAMCSVLTLENIEAFRNQLNAKMKILYGVENWISLWESSTKDELLNYIGKPFSEIENAIVSIDRDSQLE